MDGRNRTLSEAQRSRVDEVTARAADLRGRERAEFVRGECADDPAVRDEALSILGLAECASEAGFLASPAALPADAGAGHPRDGTAFPVVPGYRVVGVLGEGGCGVVFAAEQLAPLRRRVALKVIRPGMDSAGVLARFGAERQALALMDHPGVAKVFDAGTTERGQPYFAMEAVDGRPVTAYCDAERLDIGRRLMLFAEVCDAVEHAHQKGVIHRDIKPSNVLVGASGGRPAPKIIDFGIAKAIDHRLTEATFHTEHGQLIGTPEYMSPEQAEGHPARIDTRTDIYSLGVLLYELLTGALPLERAVLRSGSVADTRRVLRELDPPTPSAHVARTRGSAAARDAARGVRAPADAAAVAETRATTRAALARRLRGDLDWIVMRCLEKEPARRYASAGALADDVRRHLAGEPVAAAAPSAGYRARKFIRRHTGAVVSASVVAAALVAAAVVSIAMAVTASRERRLAEEREREVRLVAGFQAAMLRGIDSAEMGLSLASDMETRLRAFMDRTGAAEEEVSGAVGDLDLILARVNVADVATGLLGEHVLAPAAAAIDAELGRSPASAASLRVQLGVAYRSLGMYGESIEQLEAAVEMALGAGPRGRELEVEARGELGRSLLAAGRLEEAREQLAACVESGAPASSGPLHDIASLHLEAGEYGQAERAFQAVIAARERDLGPGHPDTIESMVGLAGALQQLDRLDEAERLCREVVRRQEEAGADARSAAAALRRLGLVLRDRGAMPEAEETLASAYERSRSALGEDHPLTLESLAQVASLLGKLGRTAESEAKLQRVHAGYRTVLGELHPRTIDTLYELGRISPDRAVAESRFRAAMEGYRAVYGDDHPSVYGAMMQMANYIGSQGRTEEAERWHKKALEARRRLLGPDHSDTLASMNNLAFLYARAERYSEAKPLFLGALEGLRRTHGALHPDTATAEYNFGTLLMRLDQPAEAEPLLREALMNLRKTLGPLHAITQDALDELVSAQLALGRPEDAEAALLESVEAIEAASREHDGLPDARPRLEANLQRVRDGFPDRANGALAEALLARLEAASGG